MTTPGRNEPSGGALVIPFSTDADGERLTGNLRRIDGEWVARIDGTTIVVTAPTRRAAIAGAIEQTRR